MEQNFVPFDPARLFIGQAPLLFLLEIVVRTSILYLAAILMLRLMSKRGMGQMSSFEQVIVIALGSSVGDPMFYPGIPLIYGLVVLAVVFGIHALLAEWIARSKFAKKLIAGQPTVLIRSGAVCQDKMQQANLNQAELFSKLRLQQIEHLGQVKVAILEPSGELSVIKYSENNSKKGKSVLPDEVFRD